MVDHAMMDSTNWQQLIEQYLPCLTNLYILFILYTPASVRELGVLARVAT